MRKPSTTPTKTDNPGMDTHGALPLDLEVGNLPGFQSGGGPTFTASADRPRCRVTPLGGEPLPRFEERVPIDVQEAQNRALFALSLLLIVAASPVAVVCLAILLGGLFA